MIDRKKFFTNIRKSPFPGKLKQSQVDGLNCILDAWDNSKLTDLRWLAYILATPAIETGMRYEPIIEAGGAAGTGDIAAPGSSGRSTFGAAVTTIVALGGTGGGSALGGGGIAPGAIGSTAAGANGTGYASGGSGAAGSGSATNAAGGDGTTGFVFITEYLNQ